MSHLENSQISFLPALANITRASYTTSLRLSHALGLMLRKPKYQGAIFEKGKTVLANLKTVAQS